MTPSISVVVCAHNEEEYLDRCLAHLEAQNYDPARYQIIIVDDDSSDRTPQIAKQFVSRRMGAEPRCVYLKVKRGGLSKARNTGVLYADTDLVAFIDGDALAHSDWLQELGRAFEDSAEVGIVGGKVALLNEDSFVARMAYRAHYLSTAHSLQNIIGTNMAYRRCVFSEFGGFFALFRSRGDETIFNRLVTSSWGFQIAERAVVRHEYPSRFQHWLKTRYENGYYGFLVRKGLRSLWSDQVPLRHLFVSSVNKILNLCFPLAGLLYMAESNLPTLCLMLTTGLAAGNRYLLRGALFKIAPNFADLFPVKWTGCIVGIPFTLLGNWIDDVGWTVGALQFAGQKEFVNELVSRDVDERVTT